VAHLHESAQAQGGVVEAGLLQVLFSGGFDTHEGDSRVFFTVVDAEEQIPLDAHRLQNISLVDSS